MAFEWWSKGMRALAVVLLACVGQTSLRARAETIVFPADMGVVNVRQFGAVGDGKTDDTAALRRAIAQVRYNQHLYLPDGTYLVSDTLAFSGEGAFGQEINRVSVIGEGRDSTVVRLVDRATGFGDARKPKAVLRSATALPTSRWRSAPAILAQSGSTTCPATAGTSET
jgi:hypothetical protein